MLSWIELAIHITVALMTPFALHALVTRAPWPDNALSKFQRAEPRLAPVSNLLIVVVGFFGISQLAIRFGLVGAAKADPFVTSLGLALLVLSVVLIALWIMAIRKVRRMPADPVKG
jgi:hypothetical protein